MTDRAWIVVLLSLLMPLGSAAVRPAVAQSTVSPTYAQPIVRVPGASTDAVAEDAAGDTAGEPRGRDREADAAGGGQRISCVSVDAIRQAEIRNDRVIELRLRGGLVYEMRLAGRCPGLAFYDGFYYRTTPSRQLCAGLDVIMARSGSRCPIDAFVQIGKSKATKDKAGKGEKGDAGKGERGDAGKGERGDRPGR